MNSLSELKDKIHKTATHISVIMFNGHTLETTIGTFMMGPDFYLRDGKQISEKEIIKLLAKKDE